jgi:hypothetical protein
MDTPCALKLPGGQARRAEANCRLSLELMTLIFRRDIAAGEMISNHFHAAAAQRSSSQQRVMAGLVPATHDHGHRRRS